MALAIGAMFNATVFTAACLRYILMFLIFRLRGFGKTWNGFFRFWTQKVVAMWRLVLLASLLYNSVYPFHLFFGEFKLIRLTTCLYKTSNILTESHCNLTRDLFFFIPVFSAFPDLQLLYYNLACSYRMQWFILRICVQIQRIICAASSFFTLQRTISYCLPLKSLESRNRSLWFCECWLYLWNVPFLNVFTTFLINYL